MVVQFYESASLDNDWVDIAKKEVGEPESEEEMAERLEQLRTLIMDRFEEPIGEDILSETNLKRFLRSSKWDPSAALVVFLASTQLVRDFPKYLLPLEKSRSACAISFAASGREDHGSRVFFLNLGQWEPSKLSTEAFYSYTFALYQLVSTEPRTQVGGVVIVVDLTDFGFKHLRALGIQELRCLGNFLSGGFPVWFRAIHFVNNPRLFNTLFTILKGFLSERIKNCITFHGYTTADLVASVSPAQLPTSLGGTLDKSEIDMAVGRCLSAMEEQEKEVKEGLDQLVRLAKMKQKKKC